MAAAAEYGIALDKELVVRHQPGAYIDAVDTVDEPFGTGNGLEVIALCDDGTGNAGMVGVGHSLHQHVGGQNRDAETAHPVGLHGEASLAGHTFYDHSDIGPGLHGLIGGQVADVAGSDRKDVLAQERKLGVHHPLDHGGGVDSGHIVVLEGRHEGHGTGSDDQSVAIFLTASLLPSRISQTTEFSMMPS